MTDMILHPLSLEIDTTSHESCCRCTQRKILLALRIDEVLELGVGTVACMRRFNLGENCGIKGSD